MVKAGNVLLKRLLGTDAAMVGKGRGAPAEYDLSPDVDPLQTIQHQIRHVDCGIHTEWDYLVFSLVTHKQWKGFQ